jgi:hypothetical protein
MAKLDINVGDQRFIVEKVNDSRTELTVMNDPLNQQTVVAAVRPEHLSKLADLLYAAKEFLG